MIVFTESAIQTDALLDEVSLPEAGAVVLFLGTTRNLTDGRETDFLDYMCYPEMAKKKLSELEKEAADKWPILRCAIAHRLGRLQVGEVSVGVAVSAAHRDAAFEAGRWLIDSLKKTVPIWKQENWVDGTSQWVHPGIPNDNTMSTIEKKNLPQD